MKASVKKENTLLSEYNAFIILPNQRRKWNFVNTFEYAVYSLQKH